MQPLSRRQFVSRAAAAPLVPLIPPLFGDPAESYGDELNDMLVAVSS